MNERIPFTKNPMLIMIRAQTISTPSLLYIEVSVKIMLPIRGMLSKIIAVILKPRLSSSCKGELCFWLSLLRISLKHKCAKPGIMAGAASIAIIINNSIM